MEKFPGNERQRVFDCNHQSLNGMNGDECLEPSGDEYFVKILGKVFQLGRVFPGGFALLVQGRLDGNDLFHQALDFIFPVGNLMDGDGGLESPSREAGMDPDFLTP